MNRAKDKFENPYYGVLLVAVSLAVAMILSVVVLPDSISTARPDLVAMTLIFWCWRRPETVGIGTAFAVGLLSDAMHFVLLGENALAYVLIVYLAMIYKRYFPNSPPLAGIVVVLSLLVLKIAVSSFIQSQAHGSALPVSMWLSPIIGAALWSLVALTEKPVRE